MLFSTCISSGSLYTPEETCCPEKTSVSKIWTVPLSSSSHFKMRRRGVGGGMGGNLRFRGKPFTDTLGISHLIIGADYNS